MSFVYVVRCSDGSLYTGWSVDFTSRVAKHNSGKGAKYCRSRCPVQLLAAWECISRSEAMRAEVRFKRLSKREKEHYVKFPKAWLDSVVFPVQS